jgi:hypothetical protein
MRLRRITIGVFSVFIAIGVIVYFVLDTSYSSAAVHADTGIGPDPRKLDSVVCLEKPGRMTLILKRGENGSRLFADSFWHEVVAIELPNITHGDRISLADHNVRVGYRRFQAFGCCPIIGSGGVQGYVQFRPTSSGGFYVSYEIVIDSVPESAESGGPHREIIFSGRSTVTYQPRPDEDLHLSIWSKEKK